MPSRSRVKGVKYVFHYGDVYYPLPGGRWGSDIGQISDFRPQGHSEMVDVVGEAGWNPCEHFKINLTSNAGLTVPCPYSSGDLQWSSERCTSRETFASKVPTIMSLHRDARFDDWLSSAFANMTKQFPPTMSLANSLYELKNGVKEWLPTMEDLHTSAADNFLKLKFGIEPFLKDLKDSMNVWGKFTSRLSFIEKGRGKMFREHRKYEVETADPPGLFSEEDHQYQPVSPVLGRPYVAHNMTTRVVPESLESKFWLNGLISNEVGDMSSMWDKADAFGRVLGLGNSPKIIWKATKWTWLFDWFVDTNKILDKFEDKGPFEGKLAMQACHLGAKHRLTGHMEVGCHHVDEEMANATSAGNFQIKVYERVTNITLEDLDSSLVQPSLTGGQQNILLALLIQRSRACPDWVTLFKRLKGGGRIP